MSSMDDNLHEKTLQALQLYREKFKTLKEQLHEPIAIIGASCRFPEANNLEQFWNILIEGKDVIHEIPISRWDVDAYYDQDPNATKKMYVREGGFLENIDQFDPLFFGMSPREAVTLDPQQRLLLEVSWEAIENSGLVATSLKDSKTGVFIGIFNNDYMDLVRQSAQNHDSHLTTGNLLSTASGRLSFTYGLQGPSVSIDTACSSSLVALHLACQSLRRGESSLALAGGVNVILSPEFTIDMCKATMLAPDCRCKTFDESANGFVRCEGCGIVVLKRLSEAIKDGDPILATIRGSSVNQDGASAALTVPNTMSQRELIKEALKDAQLKPSDIDYVEAHGTGTKIGDPMEVEALDVFSSGRQSILRLGSVKTNIGHAESAAGIASLLKVILALKNQMIPRNLHLKKINPLIQLERIPAEIVTVNLPWVKEEGIRRAGISSFAIGGTNAHLIVEEVVEKPMPKTDQPYHLLTLSAKTEPALRALILEYEKYIKEHPEIDLGSICYTSNVGRAHFNHRLAIVAATREEMAANLRQGDDKDPSCALEAVAQAYRKGDSIDWKSVYPSRQRKVILPNYPFQRMHFWVEPASPPDSIQKEEMPVEKLTPKTIDSSNDWLYNVEWKELVLPTSSVMTQEEKGIWVIFEDEGEFGKNLQAKLESYGYACLLVKSGPYFSQHSETNFTIRVDNLADFETLLNTKVLEQEVRGFIYLWGLFKNIQNEPSLDIFQSLHKISCLGLINFIKAFTKKNYAYASKIFVGSWSLQEEGDAMALAQWPLTALSKAISAERPDFNVRRISLNIKEDLRKSVDCFFLELGTQEKEEQIVWREGKRYGPRLIRVDLPESRGVVFDEKGTYLLMGSFGLGLRLIQWYQSKGAKNIVFISPTEFPVGAKEYLEQFENVKVYADVDIGDHAWLAKIFSEIDEKKDPLKGVIHFATKIDDEQIVNQEWSRFEKILNLKVAGAWNLHLLTKGMALDHFILFSGVGPSLDSRWKSNRSLGNAFLDALAYYRRSQQLPALTIDWGPWGTEGLVVQDIFETNIPPGFRLLSADDCLNVLDHVLEISLPEIVAASINWKEFFQHYSTGRPLFFNLEQEVGLKKSELVFRLQDAREDEREEIVHQYVRMHMRRVLQVGSTSKIDKNKTLAELGFSSYQLRDFRHNILQDLGDEINLPPNLLHENQTSEQIRNALYPLIKTPLKVAEEKIKKLEKRAQSKEPLAVIASESGANLLELLQTRPASQRHGILLDAMRNLVKRVFNLKDEQLDDNLKFLDLGMDSLMAMEFRNVLEKALGNGFSLPSTLLFDYPTTASLAKRIEDLMQEPGFQQMSFKPSDLVVPIQPLGSLPPLFCIHPIGGDIFGYGVLAKALDKKIPVYGIRAKGFNLNEPLASSIEQMAEEYTEAIQSIQPKGPYHLLGWSAGTLIASEIAHRLDVAVLICLDVPNMFGNPDFYNLPADYLFQQFLKQERGDQRVSLEIGDLLKRFKVFSNNLEIIKKYTPKPFANVDHLYLFEAKKGLIEMFGFDSESGHRPEFITSGHVEKSVLECGHMEIVQLPFIQQVAETLLKDRVLSGL